MDETARWPPSSSKQGGYFVADMARAIDSFERWFTLPPRRRDVAMTRPVDRGAAPPPLGRVGRWAVTFIPDGWKFADDFGIHESTGARPAANIHLSEDLLPAGKLLEPYLVTQKTLIGRTFADPKVAGPSVITFPHADEAALLFLKHGGHEAISSVIQAQTYVRVERWIGIVTFTALESRFASLRASYQSLIKSLKICDP
jgi:hypothetical protein